MSVTSNNLQGVRQRIRDAVEAAQRAPDSVVLIAVTKTFPAAAVLDAVDDGQRDFGENYLQEATDKIATVDATLASARGTPRPVWHFIGPIQSNKTRPLAERFDWVHSVDREKIAQRLSEQRPLHLAPLNICIQVNISNEDSKSGVAPDQVAALAHTIAGLPRLRLRGLMAIPQASEDIAAQRVPFRQLHALYTQLQQDGLPLDTLSIGMSADLEAAIAEGATIVRIGSAIFGQRNQGATP
jgi:pyridoxal phosphate enzyme (YggS family)